MTKPSILYTFVYHSPAGPLYLTATERGLAAIHFSRAEQFRLLLSPVFSRAKAVKGAAPFKPLIRQLDRYFTGKPVKFVFKPGLLAGTPFQRAVWKKLSELLPGQLTTYGALAREIKRPKASRAVGQAVGANPLPVIIPCHRVIASDGTLGGFAGGLALKKKLLALEGIKL
jgi:methylated-DNA-[protein]-cysteine S-methyltransferase